MTPAKPTLRFERGLFRAGTAVLGAVDEVGRGSPAGPATCGIVLIDNNVGRVPDGLRDSKLLTAAAREALVPEIEAWVLQSAVGHASAFEVDDLGLNGALRLAGHRALATLVGRVDAILLDGSFDWLSQPRQANLLSSTQGVDVVVPPVTTKIKADLTCASVAAASVLAKVSRDAMMTDLAHQYPGYGWESNKGYGSPGHFAAIRHLGLTPQHRKTWRLPDSPQ
ncbi:MAG TPA: ribonuclease HII [Acidimicrobiales bacterium]|nr:ribonuclease HII [Acidimicrobiales bacterium]